MSTGSVVCGNVTSSGTVSAPQLFASNTLTVTNTSDFSDDLFLTKNWAGWSKLQVSNNSAAPDSGPELRLLGNQSARVFLERDGGAHQCELIMINDEALVQTKSLSTQLSLTTNQRNPGCGRHGQRGLQHELHEFVGQPGEDGDGGGRRGGAPAALRLRGGQAVQAPGHERRPEAGLRLGRLRRNKVEEPDGHGPVERRHRDDPRSFNPQYGDVQQLGAVDSMTVRSTEGRETLLKLALPAPQGSGNAAGRLTRRRPAAVRQLDDFLAPPRPRTLD